MLAQSVATDDSEAVFQEFQRYLALSEEMILMSSKEALVKTARILAMQAAHLSRQYGEQSLIDLGPMLNGSSSDEASMVFLRDGAKTFVGVLGAVAGGLDKEAETLLQ